MKLFQHKKKEASTIIDRQKSIVTYTHVYIRVVIFLSFEGLSVPHVEGFGENNKT
jgi:hypothetical protein